MKNILFKLFILIAISALFASCEDFLEENPHSPSNAYFGTPSGATQGIMGAYNVLQLGEKIERIEFYGTVCSGDATAGGEPGGNDQPSLQNMMKFIVTSVDIYIPTYWNNMYQGIYRCNLILESTVDEWSEQEELRQQIRGEAYFLRGYMHMKLAMFYAGFPSLQTQFNGQLLGIPYIDHILSQDEYEPPRPELNETWENIIADLTAAAELLPERSEYIASEMGRATKGAALAYKAKALVYTEQWAEALTTAEQVINSGEYTLMGLNGDTYPVQRASAGGTVDYPGYKYVFAPEADNCEEIIFAVQHYAAGEIAYPETQQGSLVPQYYGPRFAIDGTGASFNYGMWDFIHPTDYFVKTAYGDVGCEVGGVIVDPRYKQSVIDTSGMIPDTPDSVIYDSWAVWPTTGRSTWKYFSEPEWVDEAQSLGDHPHDTKQMRYSDLLLLAAEAAMNLETPDAAKATEYTNMVRQRARNSGNTGYPADYDEAEITLDKIYAERRVELCFEGHQFFDIVRTGRANQIIKVDAMVYETIDNPRTPTVEDMKQQWGDNFILGKHEILPIPQTELDLNENFTQNPQHD